jgi:hypothetical protein
MLEPEGAQSSVSRRVDLKVLFRTATLHLRFHPFDSVGSTMIERR